MNTTPNFTTTSSKNNCSTSIQAQFKLKDQALMLPPIAFLNSSKGSRNDSPLQNTQIVSDDE
jgi:hypothetical protein